MPARPGQGGCDHLLIGGLPPLQPGHHPSGAGQVDWLTRGNITLDASNAGVILDGSAVLGEWDPGIGIASDGNIVRGLQIYHFPGAGIVMGGNDNVIGGTRLLGSGPTGQGNVLSANGKSGVQLNGFRWVHRRCEQNNRITGNIIGLDARGAVAMGNLGPGICFWKDDGNIVGGFPPGKATSSAPITTMASRFLRLRHDRQPGAGQLRGHRHYRQPCAGKLGRQAS